MLIRFLFTSRVPPVSWPLALLAVLLLVPTFLLTSFPASAQSVEAVIENMQARYEEQLQTVETFTIETNDYTSYHEKVVRDGTPTYRSATRWNGGDLSVDDGGVASTVYGFDFDQLRKNARYGGTDTSGGAQAHVLIIDDPAVFDSEIGFPADSAATRLTYYISADRHLPVRMVMESEEEGSGSTVIVDLKDYRTTDGLILPHRMEMRFDIRLSEEERREMEEMLRELDRMPQEQRDQMETMMEDGMDMMRGALSGDPVVVEVLSVSVNTELPRGVFADSNLD